MTQTQELHQRFCGILMQTYKSFRNFCLEHNLTYIAAGGTMLGAVRHKGLIPWDDDIDVYMPRADYNRFLALKSSLASTDYEIVDPRDKGYHCLMAKYSCKTTTLWEFKDIQFPMGVYIDVFALDNDDGNYEQALKRRMHFDKQGRYFCISAINHSFTSIFEQFAAGDFSKGLWYFYQKCVLRPLRFFFRRTIISYPDKNKGTWIIAYSGASGNKDVYKAEWFEEVIPCPFEDSIIDIPIGFDAYLRHMYGDYMQMPPKEKQVSHHPHFYLNLERRITSDEMADLLKK